MHPVLLTLPLLGGIKIYTYGLMYALAALTTIYISTALGKKEGYSPDRLMDLSFYLIIGNLTGARILYIITDWQRFADHPLDMFKIWEGGLVFFGGLLGAIAVGLYLVPKYKMNFLKVADFYMPGLAIGHAIGRLGCLASGCCYGKHMPDFPFSITFPSQAFTLAPPGVPLFPSQLAESFSLFIVGSFLLYLWFHKRFDGQVFLVYLMMYSVIRSILEIFRGDSVRGFLIDPWLSTSQFISLCLIITAWVVYKYLSRKSCSQRSESL